MNRSGFHTLLLLICMCSATGTLAEVQKPLPTGLISKIAFGSCSHQEKPQPILHKVVAHKPDLFIYLGDNIYGDTEDMAVLKRKYQALGSKPEFLALRRHVHTLSIWDDHDYGKNDAGKEYPKKVASKSVFMDFWQVPAASSRRKRPGIYGAHLFEETVRGTTRRLQVILLDTRTFRDPLKRNIKKKLRPKDYPFKNQYQPDNNPQKTLLGEAQWQWLKARLLEKADLRVIATSIQFAHEYNGYESWTNLPQERQKMLDLIKETKAGGVLFISGDVHWGEISIRDKELDYPVLDVTSSGLTQTWKTTEASRYRYGAVVRENNFGLIAVDWFRSDPEVSLSLVDVTGKTRVKKTYALSELQLKK